MNYRTPKLVLNCLRSIYAWGHEDNVEIVVVDNDSRDNSEELICKEFTKVVWLQMGYNSGFARANNEGIKKSKGKIVLLLNSDTLNENNNIYRCFTRFEQDQFVACGVQLLNADRSPQISGNFLMTGGLNHLMALPYVGNFVRWVGLSAGIKKTNVPHASSTIIVDWINGAFLMVKKTAIEKAGLMDEDFFLYSEEAEWCYRLSKFGQMCIYGDFNIIHLEGATSSDAFLSESKGYQYLADKKGYQIMISNFVRLRKQFGTGWYLVHLLMNLITVLVFFVILLFKTIFFFPGAQKEWGVWKGFAKNVVNSLSFVYKIVVNKPFFYKVM